MGQERLWVQYALSVTVSHFDPERASGAVAHAKETRALKLVLRVSFGCKTRPRVLWTAADLLITAARGRR
jgi:hypothetical protein